MGFLKVAGSIAAGTLAVKAAKHAIVDADDPKDILVSSAVAGGAGATAYSLAKSHLEEDDKPRIEHKKR